MNTIDVRVTGVRHLALALVVGGVAGCPTDDGPTADDGPATTTTLSGGDSSSDGGGSISMTSMTNAAGTDGSGTDSGPTATSDTGVPDTGDDSTSGPPPPPPTCGNNVIEGDEECDLTQLDGQDCLTLGFESGALSCDLQCNFNTSGCGICGNDVVDEAEMCDGMDLAKQDCFELGFAGGFLGCMADCSDFDTSMCSDVAVCGNDLTEISEMCDGTDLGGEDCMSLGFQNGGTLACNQFCSGFDFSMCMGMGGDCCTPNGSPGCENALCEMTICAADPFCCNNTWDGICADAAVMSPDCFGVSPSCPQPPMAVCGNDLIDGMDVCDGTDLGGEDCVSRGFAGGTLDCLPNCSGFDTTMCM